LKCKECGKFEGYKFPDSDFVGYYDAPTDNSYGPLTVKIAEQEGRHIYSASKYQEFAKTLRARERERRPIEKCKKQLNSLINSKTREMNDTGISSETIKILREEVEGLLEMKGPVTRKQLSSILAATLSLIQKSDQIYYRKTLGKKVTDQQLEKIFDVTRKTIRKWRRILHEKSLF
jgi:hypothetical protein